MKEYRSELASEQNSEMDQVVYNKWLNPSSATLDSCTKAKEQRDILSIDSEGVLKPSV